MIVLQKKTLSFEVLQGDAYVNVASTGTYKLKWYATVQMESVNNSYGCTSVAPSSPREVQLLSGARLSWQGATRTFGADKLTDIDEID